MGTPGFAAEASLSRFGRHAAAGGVSAEAGGAVRPQWTPLWPAPRGCWCAEPDTRTVCKGVGAHRHCEDKAVCLQWVCGDPGASDTVSGYTVNVHGGHGETGSHIP